MRRRQTVSFTDDTARGGSRLSRQQDEAGDSLSATGTVTRGGVTAAPQNQWERPPFDPDDDEYLAAASSSFSSSRRPMVSIGQLVLFLASVSAAVLVGVYWLFIRCPHETGCARQCDDAATSKHVTLIHHEMPEFVQLESAYVQLQSRLGLRTSVTARKRVSPNVCPNAELASPFLAALTPKVKLLLTCRWTCHNVIRAERPFHIGGARPGTAGPFDAKQAVRHFDEDDVDNATRRFCPEYKSFVVQLQPRADDGGDEMSDVSSSPLQTVHRLEELADIFAPISSPEEALSYAAAATWGEPSFQTTLLPWTEYVVDQVEDTTVEVYIRRAPHSAKGNDGAPPLLTEDQQRGSSPSAEEVQKNVVKIVSDSSPEKSNGAAAGETLFFIVNLFSREMGGCPGRGRLWEHRVKVYPNGTLLEKTSLVARPCHSEECARTDPFTAPLPPVTPRILDPSSRTYRRGNPPRREQ
jgi:hypothetical protein